MENKEMYKEQILELYKNPLNFGVLESPDIIVEEFNTLCGDKITLSLILNKENNIVKDIKFKGKGCAISIASASLITELVKGKKINKILNLGVKDIENLLNIKISPARVKCATLALDAIKNELNKQNQRKE